MNTLPLFRGEGVKTSIDAPLRKIDGRSAVLTVGILIPLSLEEASEQQSSTNFSRHRAHSHLSSFHNL
jgi:hypothetical protein